MFKLVKPFIVNRLKEPTTYVGIVAIIAGGFGVAVADEHIFNIASGIAMLVGAILTAHREAKSPDSAPALRAAAADSVRDKPADEVQPEGEDRAEQRPIGGARDVHRNRLKQ